MTGSPDGRPAPLVPPDCDMRGLNFMPLDAAGLIESDTYALLNGPEFKAAMALWCKSWTSQVPAGSIPSDDRIIAHLAHLSLADWQAVKEGALRRWVLCSDDRYYHPVVCARALERMPARQEFAEKKSADAERKQRERDDRKALAAALRAAGVHVTFETKTSEMRALAAQHGVTPVTVSAPHPPRETQPGHAHVTRDTVTPVTVKKEKGKEKGKGIEEKKTVLRTVRADAAPAAGGDQAQIEGMGDPPPASPGPYVPPDCPHDLVLNTWAEVLPELPQHTEWGTTRQSHLRARWREKAAAFRWPDQATGLAYFRKLFTYVRKSRFLMGKVPPKPGATQFQAELAWCVSPGNWQKLLEGFYHREEN